MFQELFDQFQILLPSRIPLLGLDNNHLQQTTSQVDIQVKVENKEQILVIALFALKNYKGMPIEDFDIKEDLGKGSFGQVVKAVRKSDGEVYAMKQIKIQRLKEKDKKNALNEIRFLASIQHPNVVNYREAFYDQQSQKLCVVMDFANEGDLARKIKKHLSARVRIKEESIWRVAYEVLEGLNKLHDSNIIHRDIKPANIFFHNGTAQLGDLNVAKHLKDPFTVTQTGTPYYASPQVWSQEPYNYKSDIWSLGCILYQMAVLKPPFRADTPEKLFKKVIVGKFDPLPTIYSKGLANFIQKLLCVNQNERPGTKQLLCETRMLELKQQVEDQANQEEKLLQTIKFPKNLKSLNENLPKAKYDVDNPHRSKFKTAKIIKGCTENKQISKKLLPSPSLKLITSEKSLVGNERSIKDIVARRPKVLNKNGSQKLIF